MKFSKFLILLLLIPTVANASWWNPVSWFSKKIEVTKTLPVRNEDVVPVAETKKEGVSTTNTTTSNKAQKTNQEITKLKEVKKPQKVISSTGLGGSSNTVKKEIIESGKQKCLNGTIISTNETCIKTCGDGEVIAENLKCNSVTKSTTYSDAEALAFMEEYRYTFEQIEVNNLLTKWIKERNTNTGKFTLPEDVSLSPEHMFNIIRTADEYYANLYDIAKKKAIMSVYKRNPAEAQKELDELESNKISRKIENINNRLDSINSKQNLIRECLKDLTTGGYGLSCN